MKKPRLYWGLSGLLFAVLLTLPAFAEDAPAAATAATAAAAAGPPKIDSGDTAWMLTSTALVLLMTVPGLALFYAGMVRKKKCSGNHDAVLRHLLHCNNRMGCCRIQPGVH